MFLFDVAAGCIYEFIICINNVLIYSLMCYTYYCNIVNEFLNTRQHENSKQWRNNYNQVDHCFLGHLTLLSAASHRYLDLSFDLS